MNLAQALSPHGGAVVSCVEEENGAATYQIHKKQFYEVNFCWNVLIGALGRHLYQKIINPSKVLVSVKCT